MIMLSLNNETSLRTLVRVIITAIVSICLLPLPTSCRSDKDLDSETEASLERLDNALEQFGNVKSEYGRQTDSIRQRLTAVLSDEDADSRGVCEVYDALFKRYLYTNADSAILYAKKRVKHSHDTIGRAVGYYNLAKA